MSNITIVEREAELVALPRDVLQSRLESYAADGAFTGQYAGPGASELQENFERNLAQIYARANTPRLSGVQIKAPMYLDPNGILSPAGGKPFTHILKPAGTSGYDALPVVEWIAMRLGRIADFVAPVTVLLAMPDKLAPALVVERFDIREGDNDTRILALEDFCSVLDLPTAAKYDATMERVARAVRQLSTAPDDDVLVILKRAFFAWLIADGDMHLRNMALLRVAEAGEKRFRSVRVAPLYDAVTTRVFPKVRHDRLALKLNGKDDNLRRADFRALAANAGLRVADADAAIVGMLSALRQGIDGIRLPKSVEFSADARKIVHEMLTICRDGMQAFS